MEILELLKTGLKLVFLRDWESNTRKLYDETTSCRILSLSILISAVVALLFASKALILGAEAKLMGSLVVAMASFGGFFMHLIFEFIVAAVIVGVVYLIMKQFSETVDYKKLYYFTLGYHLTFVVIYVALTIVTTSLGMDTMAIYMHGTISEHLGARMLDHFSVIHLIVTIYYVGLYLLSLRKLAGLLK